VSGDFSPCDSFEFCRRCRVAEFLDLTDRDSQDVLDCCEKEQMAFLP